MDKKPHATIRISSSEERRVVFMQEFEEDVISAYLRRMRPEGARSNFVGPDRPRGAITLRQVGASVAGRRSDLDLAAAP